MDRRKAMKNILAGSGLCGSLYCIKWLDGEVEPETDPVYSVSDPRPYQDIEFEKYSFESGGLSSDYSEFCEE